MHLSSHTWMRPEPLEQTLQRLVRLGYTSIELAGEPDQFPIGPTRDLLQKYNIKCWGTVTVMHGKRNLLAFDPQQRRDTIEYMKQVVNMSAELGGQITTVVPGTVGTIIPSSTPENEWQLSTHANRVSLIFT
ncbi:D-tagatose 3-epimerase [Fusarium mexicanum]|uniref:D-tagatose 3-epimerase n=1 Tax=Fusarium mexicanum TaxID=751941 RepID=A0A8H5ITN9_9HYPO|nr:D-tagatose 3-epimerase [Fusarium mexicanum]